VTAWKTWPGGATGTVIVHKESDAAINTWALTVEFDRVRLSTIKKIFFCYFILIDIYFTQKHTLMMQITFQCYKVRQTQHPGRI
jgi:hypothetical protein